MYFNDLDLILNLVIGGTQYEVIEPIIQSYLGNHENTDVAEDILKINNKIIESNLLGAEVNSILFCFAIEYITEPMLFDILEHRVSYVNMHNETNPQKWIDMIFTSPYHTQALGNDIAKVYYQARPETAQQLTQIIIHHSNKKLNLVL